MRHRALSSAIFLLASVSAEAESLALQKEAAALIIQMADATCKELPLRASDSKFTLSGDGAIKLAGIAKKLSDVGVSAAGTYTSSESVRALVEKDVLPAVTGQQNCRLEVVRMLQAKLIPPVPAALPPALSPLEKAQEHLNAVRTESKRRIAGIVPSERANTPECQKFFSNFEGYRPSRANTGSGWPDAPAEKVVASGDDARDEELRQRLIETAAHIQKSTQRNMDTGLSNGCIKR